MNVVADIESSEDVKTEGGSDPKSALESILDRLLEVNSANVNTMLSTAPFSEGGQVKDDDMVLNSSLGLSEGAEPITSNPPRGLQSGDLVICKVVDEKCSTFPFSSTLITLCRLISRKSKRHSSMMFFPEDIILH